MTGPATADPEGYIAWLDDVGVADVALVGGKAASLGELRRCLEGKGVEALLS